MTVKGTQEHVQSLEFNVDTVYVRTNIQRIKTDDFTGWEYDEEQYPLKEYLSKMANESLILSEENKHLREETENIKLTTARSSAEMFELMFSMNGGL